MSSLLAIDPGPTQTACVWLVDGKPTRSVILPNDELASEIDAAGAAGIRHVAIEMIACYGMPVGAEVIETCVWIGRLLQMAKLAGMSSDRLTRMEVKMHLCRHPRANDSTIRQALLDRFGPGKERAVGLKASPGPLYGIHADLWAALAVGVTWADTRGAA